MLDDVVHTLACPHCGSELARSGNVLRCSRGHSFDIARQGYVSLLGATSAGTGDTAAMVQAREEFLNRGHYSPIADQLAMQVDIALPNGCVADVGAGTGYYLATVLDQLPGRDGLALDLSKFALRKAARCHPRVGAVACDAWQVLPVRTGSAALVLNVFAPRNGPEIHRVLAPGGVLAVVTPTPRHLAELVSTLGLLRVDERKQDRLTQTLGDRFVLSKRTTVEYTVEWGPDDVRAAVNMGPSAWHARTLPESSDPVDVTVSVDISLFLRQDRVEGSSHVSHRAIDH